MNFDERPCSREQVIALQALYAQWERHSLPASEAGDHRDVRLKWASDIVGRALGSFSDLSHSEARELIDKLKGSMRQLITEKPNPWRHVRSRDRAHAAGTAGRADEDSSFVQLANADDFSRIHVALQRLGWTAERYEAWLSSKSSPLAGKNQVRTVAEVNKVWWALKKMLKRSGNWRPDTQKKRIRRTPAASI